MISPPLNRANILIFWIGENIVNSFDLLATPGFCRKMGRPYAHAMHTHIPHNLIMIFSCNAVTNFVSYVARRQIKLSVERSHRATSHLGQTFYTE